MQEPRSKEQEARSKKQEANGQKQCTSYSMLHALRSTLHFPSTTFHFSLSTLAITAFWLLLLGPLIQSGKMTCSPDGGFHLQRAFQLDTLVQQGVLWPRWSPGLVFGYGYPLFNFYPILSLYPVLILHHLGLSLLQSFNLSLALSLLALGLGMYLWAREVLGQRGAFIAAVACMLAPYQLYNVYWRGSLPEALALPLLPVVMWAALHTSKERRWRYALIGALAYAALLLTHTATGLIFSLVLPFYLIALIWGNPDRRTALFHLAGIMVLGLGLAAFFLLPAYLEKGQVQFWRATTPGGLNFHYHFLSLSELFGLGQASDPLLVNPSPVRSLGWIAGLLAVVGILVTWRQRAHLSAVHKLHIVWASLTLIGVILMMLPIAEPIWSHAPLLSSVLPSLQFPWRFLGVGSLLISLLVGAAFPHFSLSTFHSPFSTFLFPLVATGACATVLALGAAPLAYPQMCPSPDNLTQASYVAVEQATQLIGTTSTGEYLPANVQEIPTTSPMVEPMRAGQPVVRWDAPGAHILEAQDDGLKATLVLENDAPVQVTYQAFYFPGWQARLDGQPAPISVVPPWGLMSFEVPAGHHTLSVQFGSTPLRTASEVVSLLFALALIALTISRFRFQISDFRLLTNNQQRVTSNEQPPPLRFGGRPTTSNQPLSTLHSSLFTWLSLIALGLLLLALKLGVVDRYDTPLRWRRLHAGQFNGAPYSSNAVVADRARLLGCNIQPQPATAGDLVYVDLYWTLTQPLAFRATVRLLDQHGLEWSYKNEADLALVGHFSSPPPSRLWPLGAYAHDRHALQLLPGTPPGAYVLVVVPFDPDTLQPLPISAGQPAPGDYPGLVVGKLEIVPSTFHLPPSTLDLAVYTNAPLGTDLTLAGYSQDRDEAAPGDNVLLTFGWQARQQPQQDYALRLELLAPAGQVMAQLSFPPGGERYPTSSWTFGELVRSQVLAHIPARANSGLHSWRLTLLDSNGAAVGQATLGSVRITAPQRTFTAPPLPHPVEARLGDWLALAGFDAPQRVTPGQTISVTLVWQAVGETGQDYDYKAFVHLLDANGQLVAQSDAVPANWTRPTSGWQAGEFVIDVHTLALKPDLPPGEYRLVAGMYGSNGQRLLVASGGDAVELGQVQVSTTK